jgi:hypothetical protein
MHKRAQSAVELALVAPLLLLLLGGVVDVGRAFYYKIAVSNAAREAAHWATLEDPLARRPPNDEQIGIDVTEPSQEAFGLGMSLAPLCSTGVQTDNCSSVTIRHAPPPISGTLIDTRPMDTPLQPGSSWLFIYPNQQDRTALFPAPTGVAWHVVNQRTQLVSAADPQHGGVGAALAAVKGTFLPIDAQAAPPPPPGCYNFGPPSISPSALTVDPGGDLNFTVTLPVTGDGSQPVNSVLLLISSVNPSYIGTYTQLWSPPSGNNTSQANLTLGSGRSYNETGNLTLHVGSNTSANTYTFTVTARSTGGTNCTPANQPGTFSVTVNDVTSQPPGSTPDDFSVFANPSIIGTTAGNSASTNITVQPTGSFSSDVSVTATIPGAPANGMAATPNPLVITNGNGTKPLSFSTSGTTPSGAYAVTITAQSSSPSITHSVNLELDVGQSGAPPPPPSSAGGPKAHQIICAVIYYYTPITPALGILLPNSRLYIVSEATLEAIY